jgi:hypothetical protein
MTWVHLECHEGFESSYSAHQRLELRKIIPLVIIKTLNYKIYSPVSLVVKLYLDVLRSEVSPVPLLEFAGLAIPEVNADFLGVKDEEARSYMKVSGKHTINNNITYTQILKKIVLWCSLLWKDVLRTPSDCCQSGSG